jgi:hypothetical protein
MVALHLETMLGLSFASAKQASRCFAAVAGSGCAEMFRPLPMDTSYDVGGANCRCELFR